MFIMYSFTTGIDGDYLCKSFVGFLTYSKITSLSIVVCGSHKFNLIFLD